MEQSERENMEEPTVSGRRARSRGADSAVRSAALERLKALRSSGGRRSDAGGLQIKMEAPIYDTVAEEDYAALVARRREEARGFIVDDDGLGYTDEGQEEDWSNPSLPYFSGDEEDLSGGEEERPKKRKAPRKDPAPKKPPPSSLSAAAAMMGKQRLSSMFTSSVFKKNDRTKGSSLSSDSIVDDVIAEFAPDETDREERRRRSLASGILNMPRTAILTPPAVQIKAELPQPVVNDRVVESGKAMDEEVLAESERGLQEDDYMGHENHVDMEAREEKDLDNSVEPVINGGFNEVKSDAKMEKPQNEKWLSLNAKIKVENDASVMSATAGWRAVCGEDAHAGPEAGVHESKVNVDTDEKSEFTLDTDGSLPFYIIDAHEEMFGGNSGTLYLFGKRSYAFERSDIPTGEQYVVKINYPFKDVDLESMSMNLKEEGCCVVNRSEDLMAIEFGGDVSLAENLVRHGTGAAEWMVARIVGLQRATTDRGEESVPTTES
ncbi:hypothetical protein BHE74_00031832 [Ensete ventricosum]|nr:hypothetical protein BHE74_00031832 [Ensete ventricosum]